MTSLIQETKETISYLETVETALAQASLSEVAEIREELIQTGFIKRRNREKDPQTEKTREVLSIRWQDHYSGRPEQSSKRRIDLQNG